VNLRILGKYFRFDIAISVLPSIAGGLILELGYLNILIYAINQNKMQEKGCEHFIYGFILELRLFYIMLHKIAACRYESNRNGSKDSVIANAGIC